MLGGSRRSPVRWLLSPARCACCAITVLSRAPVAPLTPCRGLVAPATRWVWGLRAQPCCGGSCHTLSSVAAVTLLLWWLLLWWLLSQPCLGGRGHSPGVLQVLQRAQVSERAAPGWAGARRKEAAAARAGAPLLRAGCRHLGEEWVAGSVVPAGLGVSAVPCWEGSRVGCLPDTELWPCCPSQSGQSEAAGL